MAATPESGAAGGHTWRMEYEYHGSPRDNVAGCNVTGCHESAPLSGFDDRQTQTNIATLLAQLQTNLLNAGLIDASDHVLTTHAYTRNEAMAVWNYLLMLEDRSMGIHNADYCEALLNSALTWVP